MRASLCVLTLGSLLGVSLPSAQGGSVFLSSTSCHLFGFLVLLSPFCFAQISRHMHIFKSPFIFYIKGRLMGCIVTPKRYVEVLTPATLKHDLI